MTPPHKNFCFTKVSQFPLNFPTYIWVEGKCICILFVTPSKDDLYFTICLGGKPFNQDTNYSPKYIIENLSWVFVKENSYPATIREAVSVITYEAEKIKNNKGLTCTSFPKGWKLDPSSKVFSPYQIVKNLKMW